MELTKTYFMLPVHDMTRAVGFYRDCVGLALEFQSPSWSELRWRDATLALHDGGAEGHRESWLGFEVANLDAALDELEAAGGQRGAERSEAGTRLVSVVDPEGNVLTFGQATLTS